MPAIARQIALSVLDGLDSSDTTVDSLLADALAQVPSLVRRDRALATELVYGVLRWRGQIDWIIKKLSSTPFRKISPKVLNIIRLGVYQILFLSKIPPSAAVNDSVDLAKDKAPHWVIPFVNAVLRSATQQAKKIPLPRLKEDPVLAIAIGDSHPAWMVERWVRRMGVEEAQALCRANNRIPPVTIRANTLKVARESLLRALVPYVNEVRLAKYAPEGLVLRGLRQPVSQMRPFQQGWFQVQDKGAQLITYLLAPRPEETVLDACAGLGGKTGHIAQLMKDAGRIVAVDHQSRKLIALKASMARLGLASVETRPLDLREPPPAIYLDAFDRVLLDAPCSGLGVLRRNPDAKWRKKAEDLERLSRQQSELLRASALLVKPGGRLVYCVCSNEPEEGEAVIEGFLKNRGGFVIEPPATGLSHVVRPFVDKSGFFRTLPQKVDMDGFFAVRLKKDTL
jgi:16S rRNA (cytosine967-C5)-methyltransferase